VTSGATHRWRSVGAALLVAVVAALGGCAVVWPAAIAPIGPPPRSAFSDARIARGAELAAIGDCAVCHTSPGGVAYAGGRGVPTPFGTIYATNITPDPQTGIGTWSEPAFRRAMRLGIGRSGRHLYPALPYPHFTHATDDDLGALYAFLMTRTPARQVAPPDRLPFPLNQRVLLAGWNWLYLDPGPWHPDPTRDATWNRGAYLVEAIGHCGACHTPHNALGAEETARHRLQGGEAEHWYAPALQQGSPARRPWTQAALATYLRTGFQAEHGAAAGPMRPVTDELGGVPEADVQAMATYIASLMPPAPPAGSHPATPPEDPASRALVAGACGACHAGDPAANRGGALPLSRASAVNEPTPRNLIQVILRGIPWQDGRPAPYMPAFAGALTDAQVAAIVTWVRAHDSDQPPWPDVAGSVRQVREDGGSG
jgi:mono/diheme cytochrome c family protein